MKTYVVYESKPYQEPVPKYRYDNHQDAVDTAEMLSLRRQVQNKMYFVVEEETDESDA